jgi:LemA protein
MYGEAFTVKKTFCTAAQNLEIIHLKFKDMIALFIIIGIVVITVIFVVSVYNTLIGLKNRMEEAWSGIDVFLKKRHDLIPNLLETVKGYVAHERQTLEEVTRARSQAMNAQGMDAQMESEAGLSRALGRLMAAAESYPDLKASANFIQMQQELTRLEDDLALSRRYFNGTVRENNIYIERFPSNIIAGMFNFRKGKFFEIDKTEKEVPQVKF